MPSSFSVSVKDRYRGLNAIDYFLIGGPTLIGLAASVIFTEIHNLSFDTTLVMFLGVIALFVVSNAIGFISMTRSTKRIQERFEQEVFNESGLHVRSGDRALRMDTYLDKTMPSHVTLTDGNRESLWAASIENDEMVFKPAQ
jgi:hypothetical protein